jgi:hypothetical protein
VQAIETLAQKVAKQATEEHSAAVALADIQIKIEKAFQESKRRLALERDDRVARIKAKLNQIVESRKGQRNAGDMGRLYNQVLSCTIRTC